MDTRQLLRQLRWLAANATWSDDDGDEPVFASVLVTPSAPERAVPPVATPALWLQPLGRETALARGEAGTAHERIRAHIWASHRSDGHGEAATLALKPRAGLAVLALQAELAFATLTAADGVEHLVRVVDGPTYHAPKASAGQQQQQPLRASLDLLAWHTGEPTYPPPANLTAEPGANLGEVALTWSLPPARYDRHDVHLRRKLGEPPQHPDDGEAIYTGTAESHTDTAAPTGEPLHYRLWARYNDTDHGSDDPHLVHSDSAPTVAITLPE